MRTDVKPAVFIVVGDHAPPLLSLKSSLLFDQKEVPYIALVPRQ